MAIGGDYYNAVNQLVVEVEYTGKYAVSPDCEFEPGKTVSFFYREDERDQRVTLLPDSCFILRYEGRKLLLQANSADFPTFLRRLAEKHTIGVLLGIDETTYQVMEDALRKVQDWDSDKWVHLRETLAGNIKPQSRELPAMHFENLNRSQNEAVNKILCAREVAVVHGPPGTGKTTTLVEAIVETTQREPQVLVCAPSNAAID